MVKLATDTVTRPSRPNPVIEDSGSATKPSETKTAAVDAKGKKALHAPVEVKNIDAPELKYQAINKPEEVDALNISDPAKKNLKWLLKKHGLGVKNGSEKDFISIHVNPEGKAIIDMAGERADKQLFRRGFIYGATGWFTRLFSRIHWGAGTKMLKAGSGMNVADPTSKEAKLEAPAKVFEGLKSNRYSVSAIYDLNADNYKEPEAIALYDQFHELLEQMKTNLPKDLPEEVKKAALDEINKYEAGELDGVCVCSTVLLRDDMKDKYTSSEPQSAGERARLLAQFGVTNGLSTTLIIPNNIFAADFAGAEGHVFEKLEGLKTIEMTDKGPKEIEVPTAEVVRNIALKDKPISAEAFSKVFAMHNLNELISDPKQMTKDLGDMMADIIGQNKKAMLSFNEKISPETKEPSKKEPVKTSPDN